MAAETSTASRTAWPYRSSLLLRPCSNSQRRSKSSSSCKEQDQQQQPQPATTLVSKKAASLLACPIRPKRLLLRQQPRSKTAGEEELTAPSPTTTTQEPPACSTTRTRRTILRNGGAASNRIDRTEPPIQPSNSSNSNSNTGIPSTSCLVEPSQQKKKKKTLTFALDESTKNHDTEDDPNERHLIHRLSQLQLETRHEQAQLRHLVHQLKQQPPSSSGISNRPPKHRPYPWSYSGNDHPHNHHYSHVDDTNQTMVTHSTSASTASGFTLSTTASSFVVATYQVLTGDCGWFGSSSQPTTAAGGSTPWCCGTASSSSRWCTLCPDGTWAQQERRNARKLKRRRGGGRPRPSASPPPLPAKSLWHSQPPTSFVHIPSNTSTEQQPLSSPLSPIQCSTSTPTSPSHQYHAQDRTVPLLGLEEEQSMAQSELSTFFAFGTSTGSNPQQNQKSRGVVPVSPHTTKGRPLFTGTSYAKHTGKINDTDDDDEDSDPHALWAVMARRQRRLEQQAQQRQAQQRHAQY